MNARDLVKQHIIYEATTRVNALIAEGVVGIERAYDGRFNCKRALRENGWKWDDRELFYFNENSAETSFEEFDRDLCENLGLIPESHFIEPLEYHAVSTELSEDLINRREVVLMIAGEEHAYWGRANASHSIHLDPIIRSIADLKDQVAITLVDSADDTDLDKDEEVMPQNDPEEDEETSEDSDDESDDGEEDEEDESQEDASESKDGSVH